MTLYRFAEVPRITTEYVTVEVEARSHGRRANLTGTGVQFAFVPEGAEPGTGDWANGAWESLNGTYLAKCLVGSGSGAVHLEAADWVVWVRIVSNPEQPARALGILRIT